MTTNIDNALRGIQDVRSAVFIETGEAESDNRMTLLIEIEILLNDVENLLKAYG